MEKINWYPGHMKKTRERIRDNMKLTDIVIEVIDARIPVSSRNPVLAELSAGRTRIIALNKSDLADPKENAAWMQHFSASGTPAVLLNSMSGEGVNKLTQLLSGIEDAKNAQQPGQPVRRKRRLRIMIAGIPNVGKSSLINRMTRKRGAKTGNRPGVTRGHQWLTMTNGMTLLDTPGILWPDLDRPETGENLAFCGSIPEEILPLQDIGLKLVKKLLTVCPARLSARYGIAPEQADAAGEAVDMTGGALVVMEQIARKRGCLLPGNRIDYERTARLLLDEFQAGKIGRITLEPADT